MASIADIFFKALLDDSQLQVDAKRAGDKAGQTMGAGIADGLKRLAFGGLAAGLGIATKGLIELDSITAEFVADTGASADEADRAKKAINEMAGRNLQPMREIGKTLSKVHTDLNLTGEAAETTTQQFLKFARVTKRDAAEEVSAFDDILDAWNLTADHSDEIMDALIVSHQKYGGVIAEDEAALRDLAPALKAANVTWQEGLSLIDAFKASGADTAVAVTGIQKALQKVKSPKELRKLIADISAIEDPLKRAQAASDLFGVKAGAKLANVLRPGVDILEDFGISAEEAAGATQHASDVIDSTFPNQVALKIKAVTSKLVELGASVGPLFTGLASLASLGGALGLDKLIVGAFDKVGLSGLVKGAAARAGALIGTVFALAASGAEKVIDLVKDGFDELSKKSAVKAATARAGAVLGALFGSAAKFAESIGQAVGAAFLRLPFIGQVRAAVLASAIQIGTISGTAMGTAFIAAAAAAVVGGIVLWKNALDQVAAEQAGFVERVTAGADDASIAALKAKIEELLKRRADLVTDLINRKITPFGKKASEDAIDSAIAVLQEALDHRQGALDLSPIIVSEKNRKVFADAGKELVDAVVDPTMFAHATEVTRAGAAAARAAVLAETQGLINDLQAKGANLAAVSQELASKLPNAVRDNRKEVRQQALLSMVDYAAGLRDRRGQVAAAIELLNTDIENALSRRAEANQLIAALGAENIAKGLKSKDPVVKAQAEGTVALITARLQELEVDASRLGGAAGTNYANALKDTAPLAKTAGQTVADAPDMPLNNAAADARKYGKNTGEAYGDGLKAPSTLTYISEAAKKAVAAAKRYFYASSPPGPDSPLHEIDKWGARTGAEWIAQMAAAIESGRQSVRAAVGGVGAELGFGGRHMGLAGGVSVPSSAAFSLPSAGFAAGPTAISKTYNIQVPITGLLKARDPLEVAQRLQRFADNGLWDGPEDEYQ